jgi:hypothetical protein
MTVATIEQSLASAADQETLVEAEQMAWEAAAAAMQTLKSSLALDLAAPSTTPSVLSSDDDDDDEGSEDLIKTRQIMVDMDMMDSNARLDANGEMEEEEDEEEEEDMPHLLPGQEQSLLYPSTLLKHAPAELLVPELTDETTLTSLDAQEALKDYREEVDEEPVTDLESKLPPPPSALGAPTTEVSDSSSAAALMEAYTAASHAASYEETYQQQMQQRTFASPYAYPIVETTERKDTLASPRSVPPVLTSSGRVSKQMVLLPGSAVATPSRPRSPPGPYVRRLYPCPTPNCSKVILYRSLLQRDPIINS